MTRFFHGTKADLRSGDLIEAGWRSNYGQRKKASFVYLSETLGAAGEPTGPIEDDPNLTDERFPGNPTKSYRTRHALLVTGEITAFQGHAKEQLDAVRAHLAALAAAGIGAIEE